MSGFSIGGLFGGLTHGLVKGLEYDVQFNKNIAWAIHTGNQDALADLSLIAEENVKEILGTAASVTATQAAALLVNPDPFAKSRQMMHDFEAKYGKH